MPSCVKAAKVLNALAISASKRKNKTLHILIFVNLLIFNYFILHFILNRYFRLITCYKIGIYLFTVFHPFMFQNLACNGCFSCSIGSRNYEKFLMFHYLQVWKYFFDIFVFSLNICRYYRL